MGMTRTNREVYSSFFMNDICQGCLSCSLTDAVRESSFVVFSLCYTRDVADLSESIVARNAQTPFVCARDMSVCCVQGSSQFAFR